jgi:hypothetical protein
MRSKITRLAANIALMLGSLAVTLLACELVVFRTILVPDDVLRNATIEGVVRYVPGQKAVMRHPDGSQSLVTINAQGWNSTRPAYTFDKQPGVKRIAVIGDSYVHGAFLDVEQGFPAVLERELTLRGRAAEVYQFGMDGAPMSQYLHMLRAHVLRYKPDMVVIPVIHNDFDESYRLLHTRTGSSFMKLGADAHGRIVEVAPTPFKPGLADRMRELRTFRYLYYKTNAHLKLKGLISKLYWGGDAEHDERFIQSAVDIRNLQGQERAIAVYTRYMLQEMAKLSREHGFTLLMVMDGVREAVYVGKPVASYEVGKLNKLMGELTAELRIPFVDLQAAFQADWDANRTRFEFPFDWHWNELGNDIVAVAIADALAAKPPAKSAETTAPASHAPRASAVARGL